MPVRVLVVDDDAMSRDLLGVLLEAEGYRVECADSGDAALALLRGSAAPPKIVLADLQMPGITGSRLADALHRTCGPATLLLAMSASEPAGDAVSRFDGFVMKPFTMQEFAAAVEKASALVAASTRAAASKPEMEDSALEVQPATAFVEGETEGCPALDERIYGQLADAMPTAQLHQMYAMCMNDARDRIAAMRGLVAERDQAQFVREAHTIKGSCGMLGATELYGMAARLETAGLQAAGLDQAGCVNPLDELSTACDRLERILGSRI